MAAFENINEYTAAIQEWFYQVQHKVQKECRELKQYQETETAIDQLVAALRNNSFTDTQIDDIYCTIGEYQTIASSAAYIIGLRDGLALQALIENIPIKELLESSP